MAITQTTNDIPEDGKPSKLDDLLETLQSSGVDIAHGRTNGFEALKTAHADFLALIQEVIGEAPASKLPEGQESHTTYNDGKRDLIEEQRLRKDAL